MIEIRKKDDWLALSVKLHGKAGIHYDGILRTCTSDAREQRDSIPSEDILRENGGLKQMELESVSVDPESGRSSISAGQPVSRKPKRRHLTVLAAIAVAAVAVAASYAVLVHEPSSSEEYAWSIHTIDTNVVGWDHGQHTSISTDSNNKVHICYYDGNNQDLKYATNAGGSWVNCTLDNSGDVGMRNSMAIDSNDMVHISYCDTTNGNIKYATNVGGSWVAEDIGHVGNWELTSIATDSNNRVYITYYLTDLGIRYATNVDGSWAHYTIDSAGSGYSSIAVHSDDSLHISYCGASNSLKYATDSNGTWVSRTLDDAWCAWPSIALGANGEVHISYLSSALDGSPLKYASNAGGNWTCVTVYDNVGIFNTGTSMAVDSDNKMHIGFFDSANWDVMYATNESGSWECYTPDNATFDGEGASMTVDSENRVHFSYFDRSGMKELKYATAAISP